MIDDDGPTPRQELAWLFAGAPVKPSEPTTFSDLKKRVGWLAGFKMDNKDKGLCIQCGKIALDQCYSAAGKREFGISGLCEVCFDGITSED